MASRARLKFRVVDTEDDDVAGGGRELLLLFSVENEPMVHSSGRAEVGVLAGDGRCGAIFFDVATAAARMPRRPATVDRQGSTMTRNIDSSGFEREGGGGGGKRREGEMESVVCGELLRCWRRRESDLLKA